jgi:hypothetical protein
MTETLWVICCVSNPLRWRTRIDLARRAIADWLKEPNVHVTLVECTYGARGHDLSDLASDRVTHIPVVAQTLAWNKECLLNLGISRLPPEAKKIGTFDADVLFRRPGWAETALAALDLYGVIQPWSVCYDLGPHDEHIQAHRSFASCYHSGQPVIPNSARMWTHDGGPYSYPHSGYAWCWRRDVLDWIGGLFEIGAVGAGDHHMALALVGGAEWSMPGGTSESYRTAVKTWQDRALVAVNRKLGFCHGTIEHPFHGKKISRNYVGRWEMFLNHGFDPMRDLKRNTRGVIEFAGTKPELELEFARYLAARDEDCNSLL